MRYQQAIEFLESLTDFERLGFRRHFAETVSLESVRRLMSALDNIHRQIGAVHIAGTKGKGSTAAMVESVLRCGGWRTGLFTSPHLLSFRERVQVDGRPIDRARLSDCVEPVKAAYEEIAAGSEDNPCTFFEVYFAAAAVCFARADVDIAIYETGLGGRLDATNVLDQPLVSAITTVDFDHTYILGDTLGEIGAEKAGIAKRGVPLIVARNQPPAAMASIERVAEHVSAPVRVAPEVWRRPRGHKAKPTRKFERLLDVFEVDEKLIWSWAGRENSVGGEGEASRSGRTPLECALVGEHQAPNMGVALAILEQLSQCGYTLGVEAVQSGLRNVRWPGRFDVRGSIPWLIFDCAHNPASARALARAIGEYLEFDRLIAVIGMSEDKDIAGFARELSVVDPHVILTRADIDRGLGGRELAHRSGGAWKDAEIAGGVKEACERALQSANPRDAVCVTGSFYVVGEAMEHMGIDPWADDMSAG